jgi:hypothetical protein
MKIVIMSKSFDGQIDSSLVIFVPFFVTLRSRCKSGASILHFLVTMPGMHGN